MATAQTAVLLPTKSLSNDDTGLKHCLKLMHHYLQSCPVVTHDITRLCWFVIILWKYHIHTDSVKV